MKKNRATESVDPNLNDFRRQYNIPNDLEIAKKVFTRFMAFGLVALTKTLRNKANRNQSSRQHPEKQVR